MTAKPAPGVSFPPTADLPGPGAVLPNDDELIDADLNLTMGALVPGSNRGDDVLLTGATGFIGAFLLHELLEQTTGRVYCAVRAENEGAGMERLRAAADMFKLPEPETGRVHVIPCDLREIGKALIGFRDGELGRRVGRIVHCAAKVTFIEPYSTLREQNVLPTVDMLSWARRCGIRDFGFVSSIGVVRPSSEASGRYLETRHQPRDPEADGYIASKWVCEQLLGRAELDGLRVRVFRAGLATASSTSGAIGTKDLLYFQILAGLAIGAHPEDDRALVTAPVDVVAKAIAALTLRPGSTGRVYHLAADRGISMRALFGLLGSVGLPTQPLPLTEWRERVRRLAVEKMNPILAAAALLDLGGLDEGEDAVQAQGWRPWLRENDLDPRVTGETLRSGVEYLAARDEGARDLVRHLGVHNGEYEDKGRSMTRSAPWPQLR